MGPHRERAFYRMGWLEMGAKYDAGGKSMSKIHLGFSLFPSFIVLTVLPRYLGTYLTYLGTYLQSNP